MVVYDVQYLVSRKTEVPYVDNAVPLLLKIINPGGWPQRYCSGRHAQDGLWIIAGSKSNGGMRGASVELDRSDR